MPVPRAGVGPNPPDVDSLHGEAFARALELGFFLLVTTTLPGDQDATVREQGRGELRKGGQAPNRAANDRVVGFAAALWRSISLLL